MPRSPSLKGADMDGPLEDMLIRKQVYKMRALKWASTGLRKELSPLRCTHM